RRIDSAAKERGNNGRSGTGGCKNPHQDKTIRTLDQCDVLLRVWGLFRALRSRQIATDAQRQDGDWHRLARHVGGNLDSDGRAQSDDFPFPGVPADDQSLAQCCCRIVLRHHHASDSDRRRLDVLLVSCGSRGDSHCAHCISCLAMAKAVGECVLTVVQGQGARIAGTNRMRRIVRTSSATTPFAIRRLLSGVLCIAIGFAMIFWVLYRTFLEKNPYYAGALLI